MRTHTIRCGYAIWPPLIIKDINSGQLSGTEYDYMEALGKALNLKIEWPEEIGWADFPAALASGRIDAFCAGTWPTASRAREVDFTLPISYQQFVAFARADDKRFDNALAAINDPSVTIATQDGEISAIIAASDYPKAKTVQLPALASGSELFTNVATGKADVTLSESIVGELYNESNPNKIRRIATASPLGVYGNTIAIERGQDEFRRMLDTATQQMLYNGQIEKILAKYEQFTGTLLRVAPPYAIGGSGR